jgi:hypothetical protein
VATEATVAEGTKETIKVPDLAEEARVLNGLQWGVGDIDHGLKQWPTLRIIQDKDVIGVRSVGNDINARPVA